MYKILMVCTGNICRSPMAKAFLREYLPDNLKQKVEVDSAGTHASLGNPAMDYSIESMSYYNIDLSDHRSQPVTRDLLNEFDLILAVEKEQERLLKELSPQNVTKIRNLAEFSSNKKLEEIADPFGGGAQIYENSASIIEDCINGVIGYLKQELNE